MGRGIMEHLMLSKWAFALK